MAKVKLGAIAGQISGSVGTWTFGHNRGGAYVRLRSIPTIHTSEAAMNAKSRLALVSRAWADLTDAYRTSWQQWASAYPITDVLGDKRILTGHQAFVKINTRLVLAGNGMIDPPPAADAPNGLETVTLTADIGAGAFQVAYTATPAPADHKIWVLGCRVPGSSIQYVKNRLRFIMVSAAAAASPLNWESAFTTRLGVPAVGEDVVCWACVLDTATGLLSLPTMDRVAVTTT